MKTIRFRVYNYLHEEVDIGLSQLSVIISKSYGVISLPGFYLFPDLEGISYVYRDYELASYDILGMTAPEMGLQNFGWWGIFRKIFDDGAPCYTYIHDTVARVYQPDARLGYSPDESIIDNGRAYSVLMNKGSIPY